MFLSNKYKNIILFFLTLIGIESFSQSTTIIRGRIIDSQSREGIAFANLMILKHPLGTTSDKSGYFKLLITENLSNDTLVISHIGYQTQHVAIDTLKFTSIELKQTSYVLEEVTIANPLKI